MIVDTHDYQTASAVLPARRQFYTPIFSLGQSVSLLNLPDELLVDVLYYLLDLEVESTYAFTAAILTSRRLYLLGTAKPRLKEFILGSRPFEARRLYQTINWTLPLIMRFVKQEKQRKLLLQEIVVQSNTWLGSAKIRQIHLEAITHGVLLLQMLQGLEDDRPQYGLLRTFTMPWLTVLWYAALHFAAVTVDCGCIAPLIPEHVGAIIVREAAGLMFLKEGPVDAIKLLRFYTLCPSERTIARLRFSRYIAICRETRPLRANPFDRPDLYIHARISKLRSQWYRQTTVQNIESFEQEGSNRRSGIHMCKVLLTWRTGVPPYGKLL